MTFYFENPNVWSPPQEARVLAVLVPSNEKQLSESRYLELLARRVDWLISRWMNEQLASPEPAQKLLEKALSDLEPNQFCPPMREPLVTWRQDWATALVMTNEIVRFKVAWQGVSFPVKVETNPNEIQWLLSLFQEFDGEIQPNLEQWLSELTSTPRESWM